MGDQPSEQVKLSQFATTILRGIAEKTVDPEMLSIENRRLCVQYMLHEKKWTQMEIAEILHVDRVTVTRDKQAIYKLNEHMLNDVDNRKFALDLIHTAQMASARLFRKGKEREAWQVEKELVESLQTLGYVSKEPEKIEGRLTLLEILKLARDTNINDGFSGDNNGHGTEDKRFLYDRGGSGVAPTQN